MLREALKCVIKFWYILVIEVLILSGLLKRRFKGLIPDEEFFESLTNLLINK